jgi:CTP synthase (UTP-ammonia lyase)
MKLAIIGDFNPENKTHIATSEAIEHAKRNLNITITAEWVATESIVENFISITDNYAGFLISPGSPYKSMTGVLEIIKYARLNNIPTIGTCGGFQHMVIEFARNVLNIKDAEHAETNPYASNLVINPLSCSLVGQRLNINIIGKNSRVYKIFKSDTIVANYYCNFGLNPQYQAEIDKNGFKIVGSDADNEVRILELENHPFFIGTLFVPQVNSTFENPNPLTKEFVYRTSLMGK